MSYASPSGPTIFRAAFAPARAVYLVRPRSRDGFRRAIQEASTRWGGMAEPIIPVRKGGKIDGWWRQVTEVANVHTAVNVDLDPTDAATAAAGLQLPLVPIADLDRFGQHGAWTCHPSSLPAITEHLPVIAQQAAPLWAAVAAGDVTREHERAISPTVTYRRVAQDDQIARCALRGETQLDQTASAFAEWFSTGAWPVPAIIWVTKPNDFTECLWFWNLRALRLRTMGGGPMLLLPADQIQYWLEFDRQVRHRLDRPDEFDPDVLMAGIRTPIDTLHDTARHLGLTPSKTKSRISRTFPAPQRQEPYTYETTATLDPRRWFIEQRRYGEVVETEAHIHDGKVTLRAASPIAWAGGGRTTLTLYGELIDALPKRDPVARLMEANAQWRDDGLWIATQAIPTYNLTLAVPTLAAAVDAALSAVTTTHALSDKGRMAAAISDKAHDLLRPGVYEAAVALATPRSKELVKQLKAMREAGEDDELIEVMASRWGGRTSRRYRSATTLDGLTGAAAGAALEALVSMGWAERGFEVRCQRCGTRSFVPITTTTADARCPGCQDPQRYTASTKGLETFYQLNTLIDTAVDQGVLPHLLVQAALERLDRRTYINLGAEITCAGSAPGQAEIDIFGAHAGKLINGEVKTNPSEFTDEQIRRDVRLTAQLGADIHLLASVGPISDPPRVLAERETQRAGLALLVLGPEHLRPKWLPTPSRLYAKRQADVVDGENMVQIRSDQADRLLLVAAGLGAPNEHAQIALLAIHGYGSPRPVVRTSTNSVLRPDGQRMDRRCAPDRPPRRAGKVIGPHTLRHDFITAALDADIRCVMPRKPPPTLTRARPFALRPGTGLS